MLCSQLTAVSFWDMLSISWWAPCSNSWLFVSWLWTELCLSHVPLSQSVFAFVMTSVSFVSKACLLCWGTVGYRTLGVLCGVSVWERVAFYRTLGVLYGVSVWERVAFLVLLCEGNCNHDGLRRSFVSGKNEIKMKNKEKFRGRVFLHFFTFGLGNFKKVV